MPRRAFCALFHYTFSNTKNKALFLMGAVKYKDENIGNNFQNKTKKEYFVQINGKYGSI